MSNTRVFILIVALALFPAMTVAPAAAQTIGPCPQSFSVTPGSTYTCSFRVQPGVIVNYYTAPGIGGVIYNLSSSSNVKASIVAEQYLQRFESDPEWASITFQGSGLLANQSFLLDTDVQEYYLVVENSGAQTANVEFTPEQSLVQPPPYYGVNITLPPDSGWCLDMAANQFGFWAEFGGYANASLNIGLLQANGQPVSPNQGSTTDKSDGTVYEYYYNYTEGSYILRVANPHPYTVFMMGILTMGPGTATFGSGGPCAATQTTTTTVTTTPTGTATSTSSTTTTGSTGTTTTTATSMPTTASTATHTAPPSTTTPPASVSTVTVTATPPSTFATPAMLVAAAALVVAVVLAAYVFLGRRGASGDGAPPTT